MRSLRASKCVLTFVAMSLLLICDAILEPPTMRAQVGYWAATYGGRAGESAWSINPTADGGCAVAGWSYSFAQGDDDFWALKLSQDGFVQWQKSYGGYDDDAADLIYPTSDGGYVVTGYSASFGGLDAWVLKLDQNGNIQWQKWSTLFARKAKSLKTEAKLIAVTPPVSGDIVWVIAQMLKEAVENEPERDHSNSAAGQSCSG